MIKVIKLALLCVGSIMLLACSGATKAQLQSSTFEQAPRWFDNPEKGCGVGSAKHRGIKNLTRKAAVQSARDDLARQLKTQIQGMVKQYAQAGETDGKQMAEELQTSVSRSIVNEALIGTRVAVTAMQGEEFYSMVCLDPETFGGIFDRMKELSQKQRVALKNRAKIEFQDLDKQIEKLRNQ